MCRAAVSGLQGFDPPWFPPFPDGFAKLGGSVSGGGETPCPSPVHEADRERDDQNEEITDVQAGDKSCGDQEREERKKIAGGEPEGVGVRILPAEGGESCSDRAINKEARHCAEGSVPAEVSKAGKHEEQNRVGDYGEGRGVETRMDGVEWWREVALVRHGESEPWDVQHVGAERSVGREEDAGTDDPDRRGAEEPTGRQGWERCLRQRLERCG